MSARESYAVSGPARAAAAALPPAGGAGRLLRRLGLGLTLAFFLLPLAYLVSVSFKTEGEVLNGAFLPTAPAVENWPRAFDSVPLLLFLRNSLVAACGSVLLTLALALPITYAIVRLRTGGRFLPGFILGSYVAPPVVPMIPLFYLLRHADLIDSLLGLIIVYALMNLPVAYWLLDSFMRQIPREIEEAAWVDGAGHLVTLLRIVTPLILPGLVAAGIICGILAYNEFLFALVLTYGPQTQTLPVGLSLFQGDKLVQFGQMAAASLTGIVPLYLVALLCQRWLIGGLTRGGIK